MKHNLIKGILILNATVCYSQADSLNFPYYGFNNHYGFIIPHTKIVKPISNTKPYGFIFDLGRLHTSYNSWKIFNTCWYSGLQTGYFSFNNPKVLGGAFILTGFAEPILASGKRYIFSVRGGVGLSYHTKFYDENDNPENQFFSTRISFPLYVSTRFKYKISPHLYLTLSGFYNHISNGGIKQPNYGMNFPTLAAGLEYYKNPLPLLKKKYFVDNKIKEPGIYFLAGSLLSYKVIDKTEMFPEKGCVSLGIYARGLKKLKTFYSLNAGVELIVDNAIKEVIRREQTGIDYKRFAVTAGQDFHMGKVIFTQYLGLYVYAPYKARHSVYQKYELVYKIDNNLVAGVFMKAHTSNAELMGITASWTIRPRH
ncbi:MAG: acyloxyacyl hydrolase [Bacteroidales bacterium]|nr:acyloxyacyl hydrolase [Bacteroidales bacterium]